MKTKIFITGLVWFLILSFLIAQEKLKKDLIATTEDGKKVLLKTDGTWEFIQEAAKKEWQEVKRWKGKGIKNTETFSIKTKEWRISWVTTPDSCGDGVFQIMVYKEDSPLPDIAANVMGKDENSSFMRGRGNYHLTINATQSYTVVVEEHIGQ